MPAYDEQEKHPRVSSADRRNAESSVKDGTIVALDNLADDAEKLNICRFLLMPAID